MKYCKINVKMDYEDGWELTSNKIEDENNKNFAVVLGNYRIV